MALSSSTLASTPFPEFCNRTHSLDPSGKSQLASTIFYAVIQINTVMSHMGCPTPPRVHMHQLRLSARGRSLSVLQGFDKKRFLLCVLQTALLLFGVNGNQTLMRPHVTFLRPSKLQVSTILTVASRRHEKRNLLNKMSALPTSSLPSQKFPKLRPCIVTHTEICP